MAFQNGQNQRVLKSEGHTDRIKELRNQESVAFINLNLFVGVIWNETDWIYMNSTIPAVNQHWCSGNPQGIICRVASQ